MKKSLLLLLAVLLGVNAFAAQTDITEIARLRQAADSLHSIGRTDTAVIVGENAIKLANELADPTQIVGTNAAMGVFLRSLGRIDEALACYDRALSIVTSGSFRENPDQEAIEEIASLYINLAVLNLDTQHKEQAASNAVTAGEWTALSSDPELRSTIYGVVGSVLTGCGEFAKALEYQNLAYADALESGDVEAAFRAAAYTMLIADRTGNKTEAAAWRQKCENLFPDVESMMARLVFYQAECSIALRAGDNRSAIIWFDRILKLDGIDNLPFLKFDCYNNLHLAYAGLDDYRHAYETVLVSNELRDSLWAEEKAQSLRDLTVKYETKETELALAQSEARRASTLMWLFAAGALLLLGGVVFVVYAGRQRRRRMQKEIEFANLRADIGRQYVEGLENERQRMARELHDGVCNDLLAIRMNVGEGKPAEVALGMLDTCREAVRRISHELMPPEFAYANLDEVLRYYTDKQAEAHRGKITVVYHSSAEGEAWTDIPDAVALEIYRIVQEAVGNAVKHSGADTITVDVAMVEGTLTAVVTDNGEYKAPSRGGIGLDSMRKRANSIKGKLEVDAGSTGTRITLKVGF